MEMLIFIMKKAQELMSKFHFSPQAFLSFLLLFFLTFVSGYFDQLIRQIDKNINIYLIIIPGAIWLLLARKDQLQKVITVLVISLVITQIFFNTSSPNIYEEVNIAIAFICSLFLRQFINANHKEDIFSTINSVKALFIVSIVIFMHFLIMNFDAIIDKALSPNVLVKIVSGSMSYAVLQIWLMHIVFMHQINPYPWHRPIKNNMLLWLIVLSISTVFIIFAGYENTRYLGLLVILPGLWLCNVYRWWGCAALVFSLNAVLLGIGVYLISHYSPSLNITHVSFILSDTSQYTSHFDRYTHAKIGFTIFEMTHFLLSFNLISLLIGAMIYDLDRLKGELVSAEEEITLSNNALNSTNSKIQSVNSFLVTAQENQRQQLAKELDISLQDNIKTIDSAIEELCDKFSNEATFLTLKKYSQHIHRSLYEIVHKLKPHMLKRQGLIKTLESNFFAEKLRLLDIKYSFTCYPKGINLPDSINIALFRIIQEAVNNSIKYSHAKQFKVTLYYEKDIVNLMLQDDGVGFDPQVKPRGFGLDGIEQRVLTLQGNITIDSSHGTTIKINIPVPV